MNKRNLIASSIAVIGALGFAVMQPIYSASSDSAGTKQHGWHRMYHKGEHFQRLMDKLNFSEQQRAQVAKILATNKPIKEQKAKELKASFQALREVSKGEAYDAKRVRELADQQARIRADLTVMRIDTFHQIYRLMTPGQKQKLEQMKSEHRKQRS